LQSELIEKENRQKCPVVPGIFLFGGRIVPHLAAFDVLACP